MEPYLNRNHPVLIVLEEELHPNDVLIGRGGGTNHHLGNIMFREMVKERKQQYRNEDTRRGKQELAREIIDWVRYEQDPPGRFLKKYDDGVWRDVGDEEALFKTCQALREKPDVSLPP